MSTPSGIDFNTKTMREARASDAINAVVEAALTAKRATQAPRQYLGASAIGEACERRIQYDYAGAPRDPGKDFEGKTLRIFDRGHSFEELARGWLIDAGFDVSSWSERTKQPHGFSQADGKFRGHVDGVIVSGPDIAGVGYPCLWEHKALGGKGAREVERHGLKKAKPGYYAQVQIYMAYLDLTQHPAIFTVTNADTAEQQHLLIPFDPEEAQRQTDKAVRIIQATEAGDLLPRGFAGPDYFECRFCGFSARCWK